MSHLGQCKRLRVRGRERLVLAAVVTEAGGEPIDIESLRRSYSCGPSDASGVSELIKRRVIVEVQWLLQLADNAIVPQLPKFDAVAFIHERGAHLPAACSHPVAHTEFAAQNALGS